MLLSRLSGKLQASILGCLLLNITINDIMERLHATCLLYADYPNEWCINKRLDINISKYNGICFSVKVETNTFQFHYSLNETQMSRSDGFRDLGVIFLTNFILYVRTVDSISYKASGFNIRNSRHINLFVPPKCNLHPLCLRLSIPTVKTHLK